MNTLAKTGYHLIGFIIMMGIATSLPASAGFDNELLGLQQEWATIKYKTPEKQREQAFKDLTKKAEQFRIQFPDRAEPKVWEAIILSTYAGELSGFSKMKALGYVKQARDLLLAAEQIDARTLDGSIYTTLGSLYYQVPGWPIGFGNDKQAKEYLRQALQISPEGLDSNYFYADFLIKQKDYHDAMSALEKALHAPPLANRPVADQGRRLEISSKIEEIKKHL